MNEREELLVVGLEALLAAVHANDPKREILVRIGDALREARAISGAQGAGDSGVAECEKIATAEFERQVKIIEAATNDKALTDNARSNIQAAADAGALSAQRIASRIRALVLPSTNCKCPTPDFCRKQGACEAEECLAPSPASTSSPCAKCGCETKSEAALDIITALRSQQPEVREAGEDFKLVYIKRWRTIVKLPANRADEIVEALRIESPVPAGDGAGPVAWRCPIVTVADLVSNLCSLDQTMTVHGAYHIDYPVKDRCRARGLSLSRERVANNRIRTGDETTPYSLVIWTQPDQSPQLQGGGTKSAPVGTSSLPSGESDPAVTLGCAGAGTAEELADRWPLGCHSPNSCDRNGRCMYVECKHDGKNIRKLADAVKLGAGTAPAGVRAATPPTNRELHDAIAEALSGTPTYSRLQEAVREIQRLYAPSLLASLTTPGLDPATVEAWRPIETAPKDGSHILVYRLPIGIRFTNNTNPTTIAHWFNDPQQPGFYTSVNELAPESPFNPTHWMPLPSPPASSVTRADR